MPTTITRIQTRAILTMMAMFIFTLMAKSQPIGGLQVRHFELSGLLPSNAANFAYQDNDGIIWLGTKGGVSRYDGYNVQTFRSNLIDTDMLPSNNVLSMAENGNYYFIGTGKGLTVLDKHTFKTRCLPFADMNNVEVRSIAIDHRGNVWVGTYRTLLRLSPDLRHCDDMSKRGARRTSVNQVYVDREGNVWAMLWENGLYKYDASRNRFARMAAVGSRDNPFRMLQTGNGTYVISTWGDGLFSMDGKGRISKIRYSSQYDGLLSCVFGIVADDNSHLLWMVESGSLVTARLDGNQLTIVNRKELADFTHRQFNSIYKDRDGNIWLCTKDDGFIRVSSDRGAFALMPLGANMPGVSSRPYVTAVYDDGYGLWYAVSGLGIGYDAHDGAKLSVTTPPDHSCLSSFQNVSFITRPSFLPRNRVWLLSQYQSVILEMERGNGGLRLARKISTDTP